MAVLGGGATTSGVTEMTVNASGTVAAGDPVIASGGTAVKVAGKAAGTAKNQPSSTYQIILVVVHTIIIMLGMVLILLNKEWQSGHIWINIRRVIPIFVGWP